MKKRFDRSGTARRKAAAAVAALTMALVLISLTENTIFTSGVWANGLFFLTAGWLLNERTESGGKA